MSRTAKKSDLEKGDLTKFSIGLTEARTLKITKDDLKGIEEIIPDEKYKIRATTGKRKSEIFRGKLLDAIKRKKQLNKISISLLEEKNKVDNSDLTFLDGASLYIDWLFERESNGYIDINTVYDHYKYIKTDLSEFFGGYKLIDIDSELIKKFISFMRRRPNKNNPNKKVSERTIANFLRTLNAILNYLVDNNKIPKNPIKDIKDEMPNPKKGKKELNYFQIEDAKYALKCLDKFADIRLKSFMNVIFSLGCRREEACGLRWCDIDFKNNEVNFNYAETNSVPKYFLKRKLVKDEKLNNETRIRQKRLKTDNSYRTNFLPDSVVSNLKKYYQFKIACGIDIKSTDPIFTNYREGRNIDKNDLNFNDFFADNKPVDPNKMTHHWKKFKSLYNIKDVDLHRIRHTVANILEKKGVPKKDIAKMLGNTERVLEEFYTHVDVEELKRLRNTLDIELFNEIVYIDLDIDIIVKIINEYPMDCLTEQELKKLDLILYDPVNFDNYSNSIKIAKDVILSKDGRLNYFLDDNIENLKIKIETYKRFCENSFIKISREKDVSVQKDILSF